MLSYSTNGDLKRIMLRMISLKKYRGLIIRLKYLDDLCELYAFNKYLVISMYVFGFVRNFTNLIMIIVSCYGIDEISQCFV